VPLFIVGIDPNFIEDGANDRTACHVEVVAKYSTKRSTKCCFLLSIELIANTVELVQVILGNLATVTFVTILF
jgi:hypothetical protein